MDSTQERDYLIEPEGLDTDSPKMSAHELFQLQQEIEREEAEASLRRIARLKTYWSDYGMPGLILSAIALVVVGSPVLIWWGFIRTEQVPGEVIARAWIWKVEVQTYKQVGDRTWNESAIPDDAYDINPRREVRSTTCWSRDESGNCTWETDNYDTRYYYTVNRWRRSGEIKSSSRSDQGTWAEPHLPDDSDLGPSSPVLGNRRANWEVNDLELRTIFVTVDHGVAQWVAHEPGRHLWDDLLVGETGQLAMTGFSRIRGVSR